MFKLIAFPINTRIQEAPPESSNNKFTCLHFAGTGALNLQRLVYKFEHLLNIRVVSMSHKNFADQVDKPCTYVRVTMRSGSYS